MLPLVYFVRHGQTDWNAEGRLQGQADTDINALGQRQADRNGEVLARTIADPGAFDFVASPLRRTRETMERVRGKMGIAPEGYRTDPRLVEIHFGDWQGFTYAELRRGQAKAVARRAENKWGFVPPGVGAESYGALRERVRPWLAELARPTVCVTHGGVLRVLISLLANVPETRAVNLEIPQDKMLKVENGDLTWF